MNPNVKGGTIGIGAGIGTYAGDLILYISENITGTDFPSNVDSAIVGLTVALIGFLVYKFLPASA